MIGMKENAFINTKNRSYSIAAELDVALWLYANGRTGWAMFMGIWGAGPVVPPIT